MKEKQKTVYYCEHCSKKSFVKRAIQLHESVSWCNPANRPKCSDCAHLTKYQPFYTRQTVNGPEDVDDGPPTPLCSLLGWQLHTKGAIAKGLLDKYPERFEGSVLMPDKCPHYNPIDLSGDPFS